MKNIMYGKRITQYYFELCNIVKYTNETICLLQNLKMERMLYGDLEFNFTISLDLDPKMEKLRYYKELFLNLINKIYSTHKDEINFRKGNRYHEWHSIVGKLGFLKFSPALISIIGEEAINEEEEQFLKKYNKDMEETFGEENVYNIYENHRIEFEKSEIKEQNKK